MAKAKKAAKKTGKKAGLKVQKKISLPKENAKEWFLDRLGIDIVDGKVVELTDEQKQVYVDKWNVELAKEPSKKLIRIKKLRDQKLLETDYFGVSDRTMSDAMKTSRQNLRDIPANYDSSKYDELLAVETDVSKTNYGQLTHSVWVKPS